MYGNGYGYFNPYYQPRNTNQSGGQSGGQPIAYMNPSIAQNNPQSRQLLNGKPVDSIDVVKAIDIPLDGSTSYFPLTDNSAIVTKRLSNNGSSEVQIYKLVNEEEKKEKSIPDEFIRKLDKLDNSQALETLLEEIQEIKKELKDIKTKTKGKEN